MSLTVFYDADCQFCRHTCHVLRTLDGGHRLRFRPLQAFVAATANEPSHALLLDRLHVHDDGGWSAGGEAMLRIAAVVPALAPLAAVGRLPGAEALVEASYRLAADHRGAISRWLRLDRCRFEPDPPVV